MTESLRDSIQHETEPQPQNFGLGITCEVNGAGSTTTAKMLAGILGFSYEYAGDHRRRLAVRTGYAEGFEDDIGVARFEQEVVSHRLGIDARLDRNIITKGVKGNCVFEGKAAVVLAKAGLCPTRTSPKEWQLSPVDSTVPIFTVLLTCDKKTAAQRICLRKRLRQQKIDPLTVSPEERQEIIGQLPEEEIITQMRISEERMRGDWENWNKLYYLSSLQKGAGAFDLTIDTTELPPEQVVTQVISVLKENFLLSPEQERNALLEFLLRTRSPHQIAHLFDHLSRTEALEWSDLFLTRLHQQPELFKGSKWLIQTLHCLVGPLYDLPAGVTQVEARGSFKSGEIIHIVKSPLGLEIPPHPQDVPLIMEAFCNKLDLVLTQLNQLEQTKTNTDWARFDLATWTHILLALIKPCWDGNGRVARNLFRYILDQNKEVVSLCDLNSITPVFYQINKCLTDIFWYFLDNNWLNPADKTYFEELRDALLRNIDNVHLTSQPSEEPFFYMEFNPDYVFPLQRELRKCLQTS